MDNKKINGKKKKEKKEATDNEFQATDKGCEVKRCDFLDNTRGIQKVKNVLPLKNIY